ncbi:reverse transcriptase domain-containing protein [Tanacetum coccineum]
MLGEHNITYRPRTSVKGQILANFLVEKPDESTPDTSVVETPQESPEGTEFTYALRFQFTASNNEAEYEALIAGLRIAAQIGVRNVHISVDSKLVANQVLGAYVAKEENMIKYLEKLCALIQTGLGRNTERKIHTREGGDDRGRGRWTNMDDTNNRIFKRRDPPEDKKEASNLRIKAKQYELLEGVLYRRSFLKPWLRCIGPLQSNYVIR